ncbi:hypothetical protein AC579_4223 [Pseudocercospora musae]|uniref:Uncharacterized protein n=1 Tax=Pseudocercospora musae TaxID=113226 RepID=A0A139ID22_9PEZI|nr:hypothetical protein AC579_4223 [Pseudocercospora musae]
MRCSKFDWIYNLTTTVEPAYSALPVARAAAQAPLSGSPFSRCLSSLQRLQHEEQSGIITMYNPSHITFIDLAQLRLHINGQNVMQVLGVFMRSEAFATPVFWKNVTLLTRSPPSTSGVIIEGWFQCFATSPFQNYESNPDRGTEPDDTAHNESITLSTLREINIFSYLSDSIQVLCRGSEIIQSLVPIAASSARHSNNHMLVATRQVSTTLLGIMPILCLKRNEGQKKITHATFGQCHCYGSKSALSRIAYAQPRTRADVEFPGLRYASSYF